jgi:hypothetical protein
MTKTHIVEIRLRIPGEGGELADRFSPVRGWESLTRDPITKRDADNLVQMIGPAWESRVVALESPMGVQFAELERRMGYPIKRWERQTLNHHPDCSDRSDEEWGVVVGSGALSMKTAEFLNLEHVTRIVDELHRDRDFIGVRAVKIAESPIVHDGHCRSCHAVARALSIKVSITCSPPIASQGNDQTITREYRL